MRRHSIMAAAAWVALAPAALGAAQVSPAASDAALLAEARDFMTSYAADLSRGDRAAVAARYHSAGTYFLGNGNKALITYDKVKAGYLAGWRPPAKFEWLDLSYEPISPDAVVIAGRFAWTQKAGEEAVIQSYSGLLRREGGQLRIRLEDESRPLPKPKP